MQLPSRCMCPQSPMNDPQYNDAEQQADTTEPCTASELVSLSCRSLRSSTTGVLLINLCTSLIALYISYIISHYVLVAEGACAAFSVVFHYLVLVSISAFTTMAGFRVLDPCGMKVVFRLAIAANWCKLDDKCKCPI